MLDPFFVFLFLFSLSVFVLSSSFLFCKLLVLVSVKCVASMSSYVNLFRYRCRDFDLVDPF